MGTYIHINPKVNNCKPLWGQQGLPWCCPPPYVGRNLGNMNNYGNWPYRPDADQYKCTGAKSKSQSGYTSNTVSSEYNTLDSAY